MNLSSDLHRHVRWQIWCPPLLPHHVCPCGWAHTHSNNHNIKIVLWSEVICTVEDNETWSGSLNTKSNRNPAAMWLLWWSPPQSHSLSLPSLIWYAVSHWFSASWASLVPPFNSILTIFPWLPRTRAVPVNFLPLTNASVPYPAVPWTCWVSHLYRLLS